MESIRISGSQLKSEFARREWLITNGIGGFGGSTLIGANARGYHGLLIAALKPPLERVLLVSKLDETVRAGEMEYQLASNIMEDGVEPQGYQYLHSFRQSFHPTFTFELDGRMLEKKVYMVYGENSTVVEYNYLAGYDAITLKLTPYLNYRDYHGNTRKHDDWPFDLKVAGYQYEFTAFSGAAPVYMTTKGDWQENRRWQEKIYYPIEAYRGLKAYEDHYLPGDILYTLEPGQVCTVVFSTENKYHGQENTSLLYHNEALRVEELVEISGAKDEMTRRLVIAADQFIVKRKATGTATVIAGYPWFTDWGRDSMIALSGLAMSTKRFTEGRQILETFAQHVRHGLIPNRFPDVGEEPEYNTVDASLWFFVAFYNYYRRTQDKEFVLKYLPLLKEMIEAHKVGTIWGIGMEDDGLLTQGEEGVQLTWMDAKVGDWVVTPRDGKAVEINALWYNALKITAFFSHYLEEGNCWERYDELAKKVLHSFQQSFWCEEGGYLYDRISRTGEVDLAIRPNQVFALSLPFPLLDRSEGARVLQVVQEHLFTPVGLRSLSVKHEEYHRSYGGDQYKRDAAYHQGTVWSWLMGPYLEAMLYVKRDVVTCREMALALMEPLLAHMVSDGAIGQISEIFDGDRPFHHRGTYAQAWSVAELLRIREIIFESNE